MATGFAAIYVVLMALGLIWVIYRMVSYVRSQREAEARWKEAMYDEGFKAYLDELKGQNSASGDANTVSDATEADNGDKPASEGAAS
jgi:hypothetical protein